MLELSILLYLAVGILGVVSHFFKQKVKGQTAHDIKSWFGNHLKDTILSLIAFIVTFLIMSQTGDLTVMTAFMSGYMCDSLFTRVNKDGN